MKEFLMTNAAFTKPERAKSISGAATTVLVLMIGLVMVASAVAQGPQRDATAISTLQSAITAMGGSNAVSSIQDCILTGSIANQNGTNTNFTWTISGSQFRVETTTAKGGTNVFLSGHGSPAWVLNGNTSALNYYMARANLPFYLPPYALLQVLNNSVYTLKYLGVVQLNGASVIQIHISDDSDPVGTLVTPEEWYFDPVSFMPLRVQYREPSNSSVSDYTTATLDMSQFALFNGILVPASISYSDGFGSETITVGAVTSNSGVSQSVFDPPQGGQQ
jgi:hypothetical protein